MTQKIHKSPINDYKSNLNTSCASDTHSSMSSVYQFNINQSLTKIAQLKQLYYQTSQAEQQLNQENNNLLAMLQKLKEQLQILIQNKFGNEQLSVSKLSKKQKGNQKIYKPGCIAKISKNNNQMTFHINSNNFSPKFSSQESVLNRQMSDKQISIIPRQTTKRSSLKKNVTNSNTTLEYVALPKHHYKRSVDFQYQKQRKGLEIRHIQRLEYPLNFNQNQMGIRKSYLNSPRTSLIGSPRSKLR